MKANIPETNLDRIVIVGAGFGGLELAERLARKQFQVVLLDKNNYHQFQPLLYQVAMAGLEPSSIAFPLRKHFQSRKNVHIRVTEVKSINTKEQFVETKLGIVNFDYLVLAMGADTNFFGQENIQRYALSMKSVSEAIGIRNRILQNFEDAISTIDPNDRESIMSVVVVGGGPTGVELAGTLSEMRKMILPKDYPELNFNRMRIILVEGDGEVLKVMSDEASAKSKQYLEELGVELLLGHRVVDFDGKTVKLASGEEIKTRNLIWAAGIKPNLLAGLMPEAIAPNGRILVNEYSQVIGYENIYALGDVALMATEKYPKGHPQLAQPAIQQGRLLAKNFVRRQAGKELEPFDYKDLGTMATIGRNLAVVDLPFWKFQGFFAWLVWMFVHLMSILGVKNKILVFINWVWSYVTYDQSLRLIIRPKNDLAKKPKKKPTIADNNS